MKEDGPHQNSWKGKFFVVDATTDTKTDEITKIQRKPSSYQERLSSYFSALDMVRNQYQEKNVIGPKVFQRPLLEKLKREVLNSPSVQEAIRWYQLKNPSNPKEAEKRARKEIDKMAADWNNTPFRGLVFAIHNILQQLYRGIHISEKDITRIKKFAEQAADEKIPLILLPPHKSHMDYLVVSYVFFMLGISLPHIAAGDNLMLPLVGQLLRNSGAFFIRRKLDNDRIYRAIFLEYIIQLLSKGYNMEFFIEGGRSRTGKILRPKMGLLSIIVNGVLSGRVKDAFLVPISIGYDKVIETPSYVQELLGRPKEKESIGILLQSTKLLQFDFGRIDVRLARPFSLKDYLTQEISQRSLDPNRKQDLKILNQVLGFSICYKINKAAIIMPTAIVGTVLLTSRSRGLGRRELISRSEWLRDQIILRNGKVATPENKSESAGQLVDSSVEVLGNLVGKQKNVLEPVFTPDKRFELAYYRNQIIHLFVNEGVVAASIYKHVKLNYEKSVSKSELLNSVSFLSQLLKIEVIFLPSPDIETPFEITLKWMVTQGTVSVEDNDIRINPAQLVQFDFLCALFWPFIDSYWLMAASFYALFPNQMVDEKSFLNQVQSLGFTLYYQAKLNFYESIAKDNLNNAVTLFHELEVIERQTIDQGRDQVTIIKLTPKYQKEDALIQLIELIASFRRMSKWVLDPKSEPVFSHVLRDIVKMTTASRL